MVYLIILGVGLFLLWFFVLRKFKLPKISAIAMFTGGVKTGKSAISLYFAIKTYKRNHRAWFIRKFFQRLFKRQISEEPLFYSNIPLRGIPYCEVEIAHLMREKRFNYKSVVFFDEASLVADSMLGVHKDLKIGTDLLLFFKLFGHETHGGTCIINSHCITDLHYALRRCTSEYFYVHHLGGIPFFKIAKIREERFSEDGAALNSYNEDLEESLRPVLMSSRIFKKYDCYCYSCFTDSLPHESELYYNGKKDSIKAEQIISFRPEFKNLVPFKNVEEKKKEDESMPSVAMLESGENA